MAETILSLAGVRKEFFRKTQASARYFDAVCQTDFALAPGEVVACVGRSGSGKTTLLNMMAGLLAPTQGTVYVLGQNLYALSDKELSRLRNSAMGVIPQGHTPLHSLTLEQNVLLPACMYKTDTVAQAESRVEHLLCDLHIAHLTESYPAELSGGELRRMALARALAVAPRLVLADEPTGDLDDESTADVLRVLKQAAEAGAAVFMVTHDVQAQIAATRVVRMNAGVLTSEDEQPSSTQTGENEHR